MPPRRFVELDGAARSREPPVPRELTAWSIMGAMTATDSSETAAEARSPGLTFQDLLDADTHPVPDVLRLESPRYFGSEDVPIERYTSRDWHRREVDQLWSRVWQFACREEHIPEPGDYIVYDIAEKSYLVVRQADGSIKSFPNACLHRGRQLKEYDGRCSEIRCAFHGFAWDLAGNLADVPAAWDFPHVDQRPDDFTLPECAVGTWAGFVFINPDPNAAPLEDHLGEIIEQFEVWDLGNRYVEAHVSRIINANWKIAQEAFCEAYHVNATHPQILTYLVRCQQPDRRVGPLLAGDHARRHAEPTPRGPTARTGDPAQHARRARRSGGTDHARGGPDRPGGARRDVARALAAAGG